MRHRRGSVIHTGVERESTNEHEPIGNHQCRPSRAAFLIRILLPSSMLDFRLQSVWSFHDWKTNYTFFCHVPGGVFMLPDIVETVEQEHKKIICHASFHVFKIPTSPS